MRFQKSFRVRFGHSDPARIAYYPRFFEWFHDGFEDMFEHLFQRSYAEIIQTGGIGFPTVLVLSEFKKPAAFGDLVTLSIFLSRLSPRSGTFEYRLHRETMLLAAASIKVVPTRLSDNTSVTWPDALYLGFQAYVEKDTEQPTGNRLHA